MKVAVRGYVWMAYGDIAAHVDELRRKLTVWPRNTAGVGDDPAPIKLFRNSEHALGIPRGFYLQNRKMENEEVVQVSDGAPLDVPTRFCASGPFAEQSKCLDVCMEVINTTPYGGFLIQAGCGWGKSSVALELARRIGQRTLIIVHKEFLMRQWVGRIKDLMPSATVGMVQQDVYDMESDFVVGMVHSLTKGAKSYPRELFNSFGTVIFDEVHRSGAATWANVVAMFPSRWRIGLTATPRRKDGAEDVFFYHIGETIFKATTRSMPPRVHTVKTGFMPSVTLTHAVSQAVIRQMTVDTMRNKTIVDTVMRAVAKGRKVLIVSERIAHLGELAGAIGARILSDNLDIKAHVSAYTGQWFTVRNGKPALTRRSEEELKEAERANVIMATYQMVEEGLDIPALDVIVMATPKSDVEQTVGRVRRWCLPETEKCERLCPWRAGLCSGKPSPIVVELEDKGQFLQNRAARRRTYYKAECT